MFLRGNYIFLFNNESVVLQIAASLALPAPRNDCNTRTNGTEQIEMNNLILEYTFISNGTEETERKNTKQMLLRGNYSFLFNNESIVLQIAASLALPAPRYDCNTYKRDRAKWQFNPAPVWNSAQAATGLKEPSLATEGSG